MMLDVTDENLEGGGEALTDLIWDSAHEALEEWMEQELGKISMYGIRMYTSNAILAPHVDRMPMVTSAVINVAQDVDEEWVMELWGHDGKAYNISMEVGDMLMYESHSGPEGHTCRKFEVGKRRVFHSAARHDATTPLSWKVARPCATTSRRHFRKSRGAVRHCVDFREAVQ